MVSVFYILWNSQADSHGAEKVPQGALAFSAAQFQYQTGGSKNILWWWCCCCF